MRSALLFRRLGSGLRFLSATALAAAAAAVGSAGAGAAVPTTWCGLAGPQSSADRKPDLLPEGYDAATRTFTVPLLDYATDWRLEDAHAWLDATLPTLAPQPPRDAWPERRKWDTDWQRRLFDKAGPDIAIIMAGHRGPFRIRFDPVESQARALHEMAEHALGAADVENGTTLQLPHELGDLLMTALGIVMNSIMRHWHVVDRCAAASSDRRMRT